MNVNDKLSLLDELKLNKDKYLPVVDHAWKVFSQRNEEDLNIGWDVGIIGENRPYFCEAYMLATNICIYAIKHKPERVFQKLQEVDPEDVCVSSVTYAKLVHGVEKKCSRRKKQAGTFYASCKYRDFKF